MENQVVINRIDQVFQEKKHVLNIYFTAGFLNLDDTLRIAGSLEEAGADMLEIGIPFSDPVADGSIIQESSRQALDNGMTIRKLFDQLKELRHQVSVPVLLMGYINPIIQYGMEKFCDKCAESGVDGLIIPDLPMQEYMEQYQDHFKSKELHNILLISPNTSESRIKEIDRNSTGFIYVVSSSSVTGVKKGIQEEQIEYFKRIQSMDLKNSMLIGFGISDNETYQTACHYSNGAIIGSAFIKQLKIDASDEAIKKFIEGIKGS